MASSGSGTPSGIARLATIRAPRDLTLGGKGLTRGGAVKRKFVPIIPKADAKGTSATETHVSGSSSPHNPAKKSKHSGEFKGERGRNDRGRGRGRGSANLIQLKSTFEIGLENVPGKVKQEKKNNIFHGGVSRGGKTQENVIGVSAKNCEGSATYVYSASDTLISDDKLPTNIIINEDIAPAMMPVISLPIKKSFKPVQKGGPLSFLTEDKQGFHSNKVYFVTLPTKLPGYPISWQCKDAAARPKHTINNDKQTTSAEEKPERQFASLSDFSEGYVGKLRIRQSGKVELVLGDIVLHGKGGNVQEYKEGAVLDTSKNPPEFINFGQIDHWLDFRPELMTMVTSAYKEHSSTT